MHCNEKGMNFMHKKFFSLVILSALILSCITPFRVIAASEEALAAFEYTAPDDAAAGSEIDGGDKINGYGATSGIMQSFAKLFASVKGDDYRTIEWSKAEYSYNTLSKVMVPIMSASKNNLWGTSPYFEVKCSTQGYENIKFSAKISGTNPGPANYKLQYSTDGKNYTDVATATITKNKNLKNNLFDKISIPAASDKATVYFRMAAANTTAINGSDFYNSKSGEAAINDIFIYGTSKSAAAATLAAPVSSIASGSEIYGNTEISLSCITSQTAKIYYTVNDGDAAEYSGKFMPFKNISGNTVTIRTWAAQDGYIQSDAAVYTYTSTKDKITSFDFSGGKYPDYVNGAAKADSGIYPTGRVTASLDGKTQYSPLYSADKKAISISPDDTYTWHEGGYWQIEASTAGYERAYLSIDAYSSDRGPASMTLQYSTDGNEYKTVSKAENKELPLKDDASYAYYTDYPLPADAANKQKIYIRLVMQQNKRVDGTSLFDDVSKGNSYISKIVISGDRTSSLKMPYTTKATAYFGAGGTISYKAFDDAPIRYSIYTKNGIPVAENMEYSSTDKISLGTLSAFDAQLCNQFRVDVWAENETQRSMINSRVYTYKGDTVAAFEYKKSNGIDIVDQASVKATTGDAELSIYPNGRDKAQISYNADTKALRGEASDTNAWSFDVGRAAPDYDGYWLITASTKGYKDIKFSADQLSTSKGPRDYAISLSTDGVNYTPLANSNIHVTDSMGSTYSNISLPQLDDKDIVYIKIKIDGGETLSGLELDSTDAKDDVFGKGNTDINNIEICGTKIENRLGIDGAPQTIEKGRTYYINYTSETENPTLIIAGFDSSHRMIMCDLQADKFEIPSDSNVTDIKIMLWKNLKDIVPIVPAVTKEVK